MKKFSLALIVVLVLAGGAFAYFKISGDDEQQGPETVLVETGTIVEKALAVGQIVPRHEIAVKSKVSGTVARVFVEEGDYVEAGQSLIEVKPAPTPLEYAQAKRGVEIRRLTEAQRSADLRRVKGLLDKGMASRAPSGSSAQASAKTPRASSSADSEPALANPPRGSSSADLARASAKTWTERCSVSSARASDATPEGSSSVVSAPESDAISPASASVPGGTSRA